jgi:hypothetical protein
MPEHGNWKGMTRADYQDGRVIRYSIVFLRQHEDGWYDELRYDSHDRTRGRYQMAPHLHLKVRSAFKADTNQAESEIRGIIESELFRIEAVAARQDAET